MSLNRGWDYQVKPPLGTRIMADENMALGCLLNEGSGDRVTALGGNVVGTFGGTKANLITWKLGDSGPYLDFATATTQGWVAYDSATRLLDATAFSVLIRFRQDTDATGILIAGTSTTGANRTGFHLGYHSGGNPSKYYATVYRNSGGDNIQVVSDSAYTDGGVTWHTIGFCYNGTLRMVVDGVLQTGSATGAYVPSALGFNLGRGYCDLTSNTLDGGIAWCWVWPKYVSPQRLIDLTAMPFLVCQNPFALRVPYVAAGGVIRELAGTEVGIAADLGALTALRALRGTEVGVGAELGALTAQRALRGTEVGVGAELGALTAQRALRGTEIGPGQITAILASEEVIGPTRFRVATEQIRAAQATERIKARVATEEIRATAEAR